MIAADIFLDGFFAAVAAVGFGAVSDPPMRAFPRIALLAAVGHALRFCLMHYFSVDIATASLFASISIGPFSETATSQPMYPSSGMRIAASFTSATDS